ncbi:MAG: hypothetical protein R2780_12725 [Crocinitomicaceae bacterium]|nr:hypothetical protein [Crocinitomicaceae bacterium]
MIQLKYLSSKLNFRKVTLSILLFLSNFYTFGQNEFEGIVKFKIDYKIVNASNDIDTSGLPNKSIMYVKNSKSRLEQNSKKELNIKIYDATSNTAIVIFNIYDLGIKSAVKILSQDVNKLDSLVKGDIITFTKEKKKILGYKCYKVVEEFSDPQKNSTRTEYYFTTELSNVTRGMPEIGGMILQRITYTDYVITTTTAVSIEPKEIPDSLFNVPKEYKLKDYKDL